VLAEDLLHLPDGILVDRQHVVVDAADAEHRLAFSLLFP
jgi:hypothetical protein